MLGNIEFVPFLLAAVVLAVTPGPSILYVLARTVAGGRVDGLASTFGTAAGGLVHVLISAIGLSAILAASAQAFLLIKSLGVIYLVYLGVRTIRQGGLRLKAPSLQAAGGRRAFSEGLLTEALNVKVALFFMAFIPQFMDHTAAAAPQFVVLGLICVTMNMIADLLVVMSTSRLMPLLSSSPRANQCLSWGSGGMLIGLGAYVALSELKRT